MSQHGQNTQNSILFIVCRSQHGKKNQYFFIFLFTNQQGQPNRKVLKRAFCCFRVYLT